MRFQQRPNDQNTRPGSDPETPPDAIAQASADAQRMLAAGDLAIRRALAGTDSQSFLSAYRQRGGE